MLLVSHPFTVLYRSACSGLLGIGAPLLRFALPGFNKVNFCLLKAKHARCFHGAAGVVLGGFCLGAPGSMKLLFPLVPVETCHGFSFSLLLQPRHGHAPARAAVTNTHGAGRCLSCVPCIDRWCVGPLRFAYGHSKGVPSNRLGDFLMLHQDMESCEMRIGTVREFIVVHPVRWRQNGF